MKGDDAVDAAEGQIEQLCLKIITRYQPVAGDLRQVSAALKVITDLERISDHCSDISEIVLLLVGQTLVKPLYHIPLMADTTRQMVRDAISAYIQADEAMARDVMGRDDEVDGLFSKVVLELTQIISEKPAYASQAIDLIFIAKYLGADGRSCHQYCRMGHLFGYWPSPHSYGRKSRTLKKKGGHVMPQGNIAIVEDEHAIARLLQINLEALDYRVTTFGNGEDFLAAMNNTWPDVLILDLMLPGIDGVEICRRIRQGKQNSQLPILMLTAKGEEIDRCLV